VLLTAHKHTHTHILIWRHTHLSTNTHKHTPIFVGSEIGNKTGNLSMSCSKFTWSLSLLVLETQCYTTHFKLETRNKIGNMNKTLETLEI
jgi:hypothetical protein